MEIGLVDPEDFEELLIFVINVPRKLEYPVPEVDVAKLAYKLGTAVSEGLVLVYKVEGKIVGVLALEENNPWWSTHEFLNNLVFFIEPEHRSFKATRSLLEQARDYAKIESKTLSINLMGNHRNESKIRLMNRLGFGVYGFYAICTETGR